MTEEIKAAEAEYCAAMDEREAAWQRLQELNKQRQEAYTAYNAAEDAVGRVQRKLLDAVYDSREAYKFLPDDAPGRLEELHGGDGK